MKKIATQFLTFNFSFLISPKATLTLLFLLPAVLAFAGSRITKTYHRRPLSDVLIEIDNAAPEIDIHFIYNKLEDYTITCSIRNASPLEAIRQAIGFYPVSVKQEENTIIVEPVFDTEQKLIGRIVDEKGQPLEFANVRLFSPADNSLITGGVTNKNGDFVIPCTQRRFTVNVSYVGYETLVKTIEMPASGKTRNVGMWAMKASKETLSTVVVESDLAKTSAEKSTYIPTRRQRNAATDATALLEHMMIPQLRVNPASGYVTTLSGESVTIFIDYLQATAEDLAGMNTQDVKRVEILDYPSDVRFRGNAHVINFVMQKYEIGGYTKLSTTDMLMSGKDYQTSGSIYSKLVSKRWTLDANLSDMYSDLSHNGAKTEAVFRLPSQTITRTELSENGKSRLHKPSASLRATYNGEKIQLANRLEILYDNKPKQDLTGAVAYQPNLFSSTTSESHRSTSSLSPKYSGDWYFELPKQWSLSVSPEFLYSHNEQSRFYKETSTIQKIASKREQTSLLDLPSMSNLDIVNEIKEDMTEFDWLLDLSKSFGKHSLSFTHFGMNYNSQLDYKGSTVSNYHISDLFLSQGASYSYSTEKFNASANFSYNYLLSKVGDETKHLWYPSVGLSGTYSPNRKNSLSLSFNYLSSSPSDPQLNPSLMQENEMMFYCGNPLLKNYGIYIANVQHNWMPMNKFSASAFVRHVYTHDYIANVYELQGNGAAVIRRIKNVGDSHSTNIGTNLTLRLLDGKLQFSAAPWLYIHRFSGLYDMKETRLTLNLRANYYLGQFYFITGYAAPEKTYLSEKAAWQHSRSFYYLTAGWGNARWKARFDIVNPFRTDWRNRRTEIATPLYLQTKQAYNSAAHQRLAITVSYLFNYGKKVKSGNELKAATGGQSSIL